MLSKIEKGRTMSSVGTLVKVAQALGTSVAALVESSSSVDVVYTPRRKYEEGAIKTELGINVFPFATEHADKRMQPFLHIARRGKKKSHPDSHAGQEFIFVLKGVLNLRIGNIQYTLEEGDSVYFDASSEHSCKHHSKTSHPFSTRWGVPSYNVHIIS
jgi:mannose-6-phosphate isomerase-like protein (cupin superfamily)